MPKNRDQIVEIRLVSTHYINHLEWEDGPGSLRNVVSDDRSSHWELGRMPLAEAEGMTKSQLYNEFGFDLEDDSADGFEEYWHRLEYLDPETGKWRLAVNLW